MASTLSRVWRRWRPSPRNLRFWQVGLLVFIVVRTILRPDTDTVRELDVEDDPDWPLDAPDPVKYRRQGVAPA